MSLNYSVKNQEKLKQFLASQKKRDDIKPGNKKDKSDRRKSLTN